MEFKIIFEGEISLPANFLPNILPKPRVKPLFKSEPRPKGYKVIIKVEGTGYPNASHNQHNQFVGYGLSKKEAIDNASAYAQAYLKLN